MPRPRPPSIPTRETTPSVTSTSPSRSKPSTKAACTPSFIVPVYEWFSGWSIPVQHNSVPIRLYRGDLVYTIAADGRDPARRCDEGVRRSDRGRRRLPARLRRRVPRPRGPFGLWQVDAAPDDRGARRRDDGRDPDRRPRRHRPAAAEPRHRDGLPDLRPLPAHVGAPEH